MQPQQGFTRQLLHQARNDDRADAPWIVFGGPHGQSFPIGTYEKALLVADGPGIAAQLPYLKRLIHGYHARQVLTRGIHLVWQISDISKSVNAWPSYWLMLTSSDVGIAAQPLLNNALDADKLKNGGVSRNSRHLTNSYH